MFVDALVRRKSLFTFGLLSRGEFWLTPGCGLGLVREHYNSFAVKKANSPLVLVAKNNFFSGDSNNHGH